MYLLEFFEEEFGHSYSELVHVEALSQRNVRQPQTELALARTVH